MRKMLLSALPAVLLLLAAPLVVAQSVKILDDFESGPLKWSGQYIGSTVDDYATHGAKAFKIAFPAGIDYPGISARAIDLDWSSFDTLRMDIYNPQGAPVNLNIRIDDSLSTATYASRYNGEFLIVNGQTLLTIPFAKITASSRPLTFSDLRVFTIFMSSPSADTTLYIDNIRVTRGPEPLESRGRVISADVDDTAINALKARAVAAKNRLAALIPLAHKKGIGTLEANIALITASLGLDVRPQLPWFASRKAELYAYVADSCAVAGDDLEKTLKGERQPSPVPPGYDTAELVWKGPGLFPRESGAAPRPVLLFSMLYQRSGPLCEYFAPINYFTHTHSFAGASRYDVDRTPLYKAFHEFPDTHRVWNDDEGWCGHIVRDSSSLGGGAEPLVVCLESPHTKKAIEEYIRRNASSWQSDPRIHLNIMGGELSYICYCPRTLEMFRDYLAQIHGDVASLNAVWAVDYKSFDDVKVMPNAAQSGDNRARWYDWQAFNCYRFVEHAKWAKSIIRSISPDIPVAAGAVSYSVRASLGRSGVDEENLVRQVDDVVLNEGGSSTITTDLLYSFAEGAKPLLDFEYHGDIPGLLPHFLHGNSAMAMWWWPEKPDTEFPQFNETAIPFSWNIPLADVAECLKIGLDIRRIGADIAAFPKAPAEIAILYSRPSMLQVPPEFARGTDTPYTLELKKVYAASLGLDAPVKFISSLQVQEGKLAGLKLLVVPAATYVFDDEAKAVFDFVRSGGALVMTPDSFMFDQYARPRSHIGALGITVDSIEKAAYTASSAGRDDFLQGMISVTSQTDSPAIEITCGPDSPLPDKTTLRGRGSFQSISVAAPAKVVALASDNRPALVEVLFGSGFVYYLAVPLEPESMNTLLDAVTSRCGVSRPVRFATPAGRDWRLECRALSTPNTVLFYVVNHSDAAVRVNVTLPFEPGDCIDFRDPSRPLDLDRLDVPARRTAILAVKRRQVTP